MFKMSIPYLQMSAKLLENFSSVMNATLILTFQLLVVFSPAFKLGTPPAWRPKMTVCICKFSIIYILHVYNMKLELRKLHKIILPALGHVGGMKVT